MSRAASIAVIGVGNIGSRHLQALAHSDFIAHIQAVDTDLNALAVARDRVGANTSPHACIEYLSNMMELQDSLDVVIVASSSASRRMIVEKLLREKNVRHLVLEKFLFQSRDDYARIGELLDRRKVGAWVNCARRMWPSYQKMRSRFSENDLMRMSVSGSNIGIGCNGIHFLDMFSYLTRQRNIHLEDALGDGYIQSKRAGYIEFLGSICGKTPSHSYFSLTSYLKPNIPVAICLESESVRVVINEGDGKALISDERTDWQWKEEDFFCPMQSQLTHLLVKELIETGECSLANYNESSQLHVQLLSLFLEHLRRCSGGAEEICPIT